MTPEQQYALTKVRLLTLSQDLHMITICYPRQAFDPTSESYGHGNNKTGSEVKSVLHPDLKTIPRVRQVQLIGNGTVYNHEGLVTATLKHPSHTTFHHSRVSIEDEEKGVTRYYRWHIDAALYELNPPRVTTLYALKVPRGEEQTCRYDDGTGDELRVPLGTTAFVSGRTMFEILPPEYQSLAVRTKVKYAPHPYVWMAPARAMPTGLGILTEGRELGYEKLPAWEEGKIKVFPMVCVSFVFHIFPFPLRAHISISIYTDIMGTYSSGKTPSQAGCTSKCTPAALPSSSSIRSLLLHLRPSRRQRYSPTARI